MAQLQDRLQIILGLDISQLDSQLNKAKGSSNGFVNFIKGAFQFTVGQGIFDGLNKAMEITKSGFIDFNASLETNLTSFKAMMNGSSEGAQDLLNWIVKFSSKTPFLTKDLAESAKMLMALGMEANKVPKALKSIADMTAYVGGDSDKMNRISYALGEMLTQGTVTSMRMRELTNNSVPAWDLLSKAIGKSTAETKKLVEEGAVPAKQAVDALLDGMENRAKDFAEKQSHTFTGMLTTLQDNVQISVGKVSYKSFKDLEGIIGQVIKKTQTFTATFEDGGLDEAIRSVFPDDFAEAFIKSINYVKNTTIPVLEDLGKNGLKFLSAEFKAINSDGSLASGAINMFTGAIKLLSNGLGWLADHEAVLEIVTNLIVVKLIGGIALGLTSSVLASITGFTAAIGEAGLAGALGKLAPFAVSNPIVAVAVGISALITGSIAAYVGQLEKMKGAVKDIQDLVKNGIQNKSDYNKSTKISSTASKKLEQDSEINKKIKPNSENKNTKDYKLIQSLKDSKSPTDHKKVLAAAKRLGVINYTKDTSNAEIAKIAEIQFQNDALNSNVGYNETQKLQDIKNKNRTWYNNNGFLGMSASQIKTFVGKMKDGESFYKQVQTWKKDSKSKNGLSKQEKSDASTLKKDILNLDKERSNIKKNQPAILRDKQVIAWASLPYKTLSEKQKKKVDEYNKVLKKYNNDLKNNRMKYNWYGTSLENKNNTLSDLNKILSPKPKTTTPKTTDSGNELEEYIKKQEQQKKSTASKIKAIKNKYNADNKNRKGLTNLENDAKNNLAGTPTIKKLNKALSDKNQVLGLLQSEYQEMSAIDAGAANIILQQIGTEQASITSIKDKITTLNTKTKNQATKNATKATKDWVKEINNRFAKVILDNEYTVEKNLNAANKGDGNDLGRLKTALKYQKSTTTDLYKNYTDLVKRFGKNSEEANSEYKKYLDSLQKENDINNQITDLKKTNPNGAQDILMKLNKKLVEAILPVTGSKTDTLLKQHQQGLQGKLNQTSQGLNNSLAQYSFDFTKNNGLQENTGVLKSILQLLQQNVPALSVSNKDIQINVTNDNKNIGMEIVNDLKKLAYLGAGAMDINGKGVF